ncbi:Nucleolar protein 12, partial [Globisporangium splendens]
MPPKNMKRGGDKHGKKPSGGGVKKGSIGSGGIRKPNPKKKSKLVVTFDPEKRKEYLTGFHKRKQERRRFGLDMEAFKQQKRLLEARKQRREEQKEKLASLNLLEPPEEQEEEKKEDSDDDEESKAVTKVMHFDDEHTQNKFGDVVTVTTSIGDLQSDSEDEISDEEYDLSDDDEDATESGGKRDHSKFKEKQLSLFQRIQLKRRGMALPSKRAKLKEARANRKATLGKKSHRAKIPNKKDAIEVVAAGGGKPKKGAFGKGKFSKR